MAEGGEKINPFLRYGVGAATGGFAGLFAMTGSGAFVGAIGGGLNEAEKSLGVQVPGDPLNDMSFWEIVGSGAHLGFEAFKYSWWLFVLAGFIAALTKHMDDRDIRNARNSTRS